MSGIVVDHRGRTADRQFPRAVSRPADWLPLGEVAGADAVLADPRWPKGAEALFDGRARATACRPCSTATWPTPRVFETLLPLTDHAVFSEPALAGFAGSTDDAALARLAGSGCRLAAVTRGADGVAGWTDGVVRHQPAYAVDAVDTTGAGDVFHGA